MIYYLPSCNFTAAHLSTSNKIKNYFKNETDVTVCGCCRVSQKNFTKDDTVLSLCLTCAAITNENNPETREMSVFEYLLRDEKFPWPDYHGEEMILQDCWRARNRKGHLQAVRDICRKMHINIIELEENKEKCEFDGVWRMNPVMERNKLSAPIYFRDIEENCIDIKDKGEQITIMKKWCEQYGEKKVITYCVSCESGVKTGGGNVVHLMDLVVRDLD